MAKTTTTGSFTKTTITEVEAELDYISILKSLAPEIAKSLSDKAPRNTGVYANGFNYEIIKDKGETKLYVFNDSRKQSLSHIIEFGTSGENSKPPQPHYRPVYEEYKNKYAEEMKKVDIKKGK